MSPLINFPNDLEDGVDTAFGSDVIENLQAIKDVVHALDYQNLAGGGPGANFPGTCISPSPQGIPTDRINDDAVTAAKLADATLDVNDLQRAVTADHIRLLAVQRKHLDTTAGAQAVAFPQMALLVQATAFDFLLAQTGASSVAGSLAGWGFHRRTTGANYDFLVWGQTQLTGTMIRNSSGAVTPATAIPTAQYHVIGAYLSDVVYNGAGTFHMVGNLVSIALKIA